MRRPSKPRTRRSVLSVEILEDRTLLSVQPLSLADPALYGSSGNGLSGNPSVSDDGQIVAFISRSANLAANDFNGADDIYVLDRGNGQTRLVSVSTSGTAGNGAAVNPRVSGDGRFVVFESDASDLVAGDTNSLRDVFVRDLVTSTTTRVSVSTGGVEANAGSANAIVTPDGRFVVFESDASSLVAGDSNGMRDVFVRDLLNSTTTRVSVSTGGVQGNNSSNRSAITPDGRFVAFVSSASNLTTQADTNSAFDVFVRDTQNNTTTLVSIAGTGGGAGVATGNGSSREAVISPNGQFVAFSSLASNLTATDTEAFSDVFVRDLVTSTTTLVSVNHLGVNVGSDAVGPAMSADGNVIAWVDSSGNLTPIADANSTYDVFVRNRSAGTTVLVSVNTTGSASGNAISGGDGNGSAPNVPLAITADGRYVGFVSVAGNLVAGDATSAADVFVRDLQGAVTRLVSTTGSGSGNGPSGNVPGNIPPSFGLSSDGQTVAFQSSASNLVAGDDNQLQDVFVRDLAGGTTELASPRSSSLPPEFTANGDSQLMAVSPNGRFVLFRTPATNVVLGVGLTSGSHLYLRDRLNGTTRLIDINFQGTATGDAGVFAAAVSSNGRYVAFGSDSSVPSILSDPAPPTITEGNSFESDVFLRDLQTGTTRLVSFSSAALRSGNQGSTLRGLSDDGRWVLFESRATDLVAGFTDGNGGGGDVFVRDMTLGAEQTYLVSRSTAGATTGGNGESAQNQAVIAPDGSKVAFTSTATNLVAGFVNNNGGFTDVFVTDLGSFTTQVVSAGTTGPAAGGDAASLNPAFSGDGTHVGFVSDASNLVAGFLDFNGSFTSDIFVRNLAGGVTRLASGRDGMATTNGDGGVGTSRLTLSNDGRYVAFDSVASNLVAGDLNFQFDVFVRDTQTNATTLVSVATTGGSSNNSSTGSTISGNGRYVTFVSTATNLVAGFVDGNLSFHGDAYIRDLQGHTTTLITQNVAGTASGSNDTSKVLLSRDGSTAVIESNAANLSLADHNARPGINGTDVFAFDVSASGAIRGRVFDDSDGDGIQGAGEAGIPDWSVFLDDGDGVQEAGERTVTTNGTGDYEFDSLSAGAYLVAQVLEAGYVQTAPLPVPPGQHAVTLASNNDVATDKDFGVRQLGPNLKASVVSVPPNGLIGRTIDVTWTVTNIGTLPAAGSWQDAIFLSPTPTLGPGAILLGTVPHVGGLGTAASYPGNATVELSRVPLGDYYVIVQADRRHQVSGDLQLANNVAASAVIAVDVTPLTPGTPRADAFNSAGQDLYFKVTVPPGGTLTLALDSAAIAGGTALRIRRGSLPTLWDFDAGTTADGPDQQLRVPNPAGGTYYILAHSTFGAAAVSGFTLTAAVDNALVLDAFSPATGGDTGQVMVAIRGANFTDATTASLVRGGTTLNAVAYDRRDPSLFYATFDLTGAAQGAYDLRLDDGSNSVTAVGAFAVVPGVLRVDVSAVLVVPAGVRINREGFIVVDYINNGNIDAPAGLYRVAIPGVNERLPDQPDFVADSASFLAVAPDGPAGVLRPGQHGRTVIRIVAPPNIVGDVVPVELSSVADDAPVDWDSFKDALRTPSIPADAWEVIWTNFLGAVGTTAGDLQKVLDDNASYLSRLGIVTGDVNRLLGFEIQKANAGQLGPVLANRVDAAFPTPGVPLSLSAAFLQPIAGRYRLGPMGRGWAHSWEASASTDAAGNVLFDFAGSPRFFVLKPDGTYGGAPGEAVTLTRPGGAYRLREADGTVQQFRPDGVLDFVEDTHGNRVTAGYDGNGRLATLTHSSGAVLTLAYNAQDRIDSVTDDAGRVTSYTYDPAGEHLLQVTDASGTRSYQYVTGQGAAREHALAQVTDLDGTSIFYAYDARGRLAGTQRDGGAEPVLITYDAFAGVTFTNVAGDATTILYNDLGQPELTRDALGRTAALDYDTAGNLVRTLSPTGLTALFEYDVRGNLTRQTDALGRRTQFLYETTFNQLASYTDSRGNTTRYAYDAQANLRSITYANGTQEQFDYDPLGNLTEVINRRGNAINSVHDARGLVTRKDFTDLTHQEFTHDGRGNMKTAKTFDASNVLTADILLNYDTADRLTRIDYLSDGRFLVFTYDANRRSQSVDQDGYTVNYTYNALGRLFELRDGSDVLIVRYTYDALGRLSLKELGNDTFTTYAYDAAGQLLSMVNHAPGGAVNSQFDYTYDAEGRRTSMTTPDGITTYAYDEVGQLTHVALPGGRTIDYTYDPAGNRVRVVDSLLGTTDYTADSVNQYTSIGGVAQTYDLDGNLTDDGTSTYTWDDLNRLTGVTGPGGTFTYEYDVFGNRTGVTIDGVRTEYLFDPAGLGNLVGEYGPAGAAQYVHGLGLVGRTDAGGTSFFDFDGNANVAGLTGVGGGYVNRYSYLPFGATAELFAAVTNPFTFVGEFGATADGSGLVHMRARDYGPDVGQFLSADPIGLGGGDANLRRYVDNNPASFIDPLGLDRKNDEAELAVLELNNLARGLFRDYALDAAIEQRRKEIAAEDQLPVTPPLDILLPPEAREQLRKNEENRRRRENLDSLIRDAQPDLLSLKHLKLLRSFDPNDIIGPGGFGPEQFIRPEGTWGYTVHYENQASATAPAQDVVITQALDPDLDWANFEFASFGFGSRIVEVPAGLQKYQTQVDYQNQDGSPLSVDVTLDLNRDTGVATWTLRSIDPDTGTFPLDLLAGFLPVNDATGRGEGFVTYFVQPKSTLVTGTTIDAQASIVFDINAPIITNLHTNTIDAGVPSSHINPLPAFSFSNQFTVGWSGEDAAGGSGVASFTIFVSVDGGAFQPFLVNTTVTSAVFTGQPGHTYRFLSRATDNVGNVESLAGALAAVQTITVATVPIGLSAEKLFQISASLTLTASTSTVAASRAALAGLAFPGRGALGSGGPSSGTPTAAELAGLEALATTFLIGFGDESIAAGGAISGRVCRGLDGDGNPAADDPGLAGQRVILEMRIGDRFVPLRSVTTEANGEYNLTDLAPGVYRVRLEGRAPGGGVRSHEVLLKEGGKVQGKHFGKTQRSSAVPRRLIPGSAEELLASCDLDLLDRTFTEWALDPELPGALAHCDPNGPDDCETDAVEAWLASAGAMTAFLLGSAWLLPLESNGQGENQARRTVTEPK